jgi:hypothetical protein
MAVQGKQTVSCKGLQWTLHRRRRTHVSCLHQELTRQMMTMTYQSLHVPCLHQQLARQMMMITYQSFREPSGLSLLLRLPAIPAVNQNLTGLSQTIHMTYHSVS